MTPSRSGTRSRRTRERRRPEPSRPQAANRRWTAKVTFCVRGVPLAGNPRSCGAGDRLRRPPPSAPAGGALTETEYQALGVRQSIYAAGDARAAFDTALADCVARLGADAVCYSLIVADFHPLLLAGFAGAPEITL